MCVGGGGEGVKWRECERDGKMGKIKRCRDKHTIGVSLLLLCESKKALRHEFSGDIIKILKRVVDSCRERLEEGGGGRRCEV